MKVLVNGGLNLSELDGWWAEAYAPDLGWALGDGKEHGNDSDWDAAEAVALTNGSNARWFPNSMRATRKASLLLPGSNGCVKACPD